MLAVAIIVSQVDACTPLGMWGCIYVQDCCWSPRGRTCHLFPGQSTGLCTEDKCLSRGEICGDDYDCCSRNCFRGRYAHPGGVCK